LYFHGLPTLANAENKQKNLAKAHAFF